MRLNKNFTLIIISIVFIAVGFGFLAPSINEKAPLDTAPISYSQMTSSNISPGQRIQGEIVGNYGTYREKPILLMIHQVIRQIRSAIL